MGKVSSATQSCDKPVRFLALGDSYTVGEGIADHDSWPQLLRAQLRVVGVTIDEIIVVARTGWTTDELLDALAARPICGSFDLVTLAIGVNNQYRNWSKATYRKEFIELLDRCCRLARRGNDGVVVISIPDWGVTPFARSREVDAIATEIDLFNQINKSAAVAASVRYVDVTRLTRMSGAGELVAPDGLHPSQPMYARWVGKILPVAADILDCRSDEDQVFDKPSP